jgi:type I restriction enzyme S subunit
LLPTVLQRIEDATPFVTVKHLSSEDLKDEVIALPSPSEQKRIGRILEQADRLRLIRRYALELGEPFLPAAFVNLFGDPDVNPNEFRITGLGEYLSFVTSGSRGWAEYYVPQGTRFIRSLDVRMNHIAATNAVFVNPPDGAEADRTRVKAGDVLLTITGAQVGRVAPVPKRIEGAFVSQHVSILRLKKGISPIFLSMYLSLESGGQREINRLQYGQTKPGLNLQQIREFQILAPPLAIQQEFEAIVERYERLLSVHREALRQAEHLFQTLLHRAFTTGL